MYELYRNRMYKMTQPAKNRVVDPKLLCQEMLHDVLKVPMRNRPNRSLI